MLQKLERVYEKVDKLYIVGYSRGATVSRKFASYLHNDGLQTKGGEHMNSPSIGFLGCFDTVALFATWETPLLYIMGKH